MKKGNAENNKMFVLRIKSLIWKSKSETSLTGDSWLRRGGNMTDLQLKLSKQVEQRKRIVRMLEEEMKIMNQVISDFVFLHKKVAQMEIEDDANDCQSRYLYSVDLQARNYCSRVNC